MSKDSKKVQERKYFMSREDQEKMKDLPRTHRNMIERVGAARKGKTKQDKFRKGIV